MWVGLLDPGSKFDLEINGSPPNSRFGRRCRPGDALDPTGFDIGPRKTGS